MDVLDSVVVVVFDDVKVIGVLMGLLFIYEIDNVK